MVTQGLFAPKILRAEVIEGIDLESGAYLTGDRLTIGAAADDTLQLGAAGIVPGHLTLERRRDGKGWEYFSSDRGLTEVGRGNPRTGAVRAGLRFRLGPDTHLEILRVPAPDELRKDAGASAEKTEVPLWLALPIIAAMLGAFMVFFIAMTQGNDRTSGPLRTQAWYLGDRPLEPAMALCLEAATPPVGQVPTTAPDATFRRYFAATSDPARTATAGELTDLIHAGLVRAHLLAKEGLYQEAADELRVFETILPVGDVPCPILQASRSDLAAFQLRARRR
ncbi:MAG: hypothetical protein AAGF74_11265 [Pseudomonadota bacterium]